LPISEEDAKVSQSIRRLALSLSLALVTALASAQTTPSPWTGPKPATVYVQDFEAHTGDSGNGGSSRRGPLSILRGARADQKAVASAGSLSGSIADQFKSMGFNAQRISREDPLPKDGWLVTGIFYAINSQTGMIQMPSFLSGKPDPVNTQITVSVADLARNPSAPFIVFGKAEALRGQGPPAGWNPYVVAAKFVINTVESAADINKLAKEIVDTILTNKSEIDKAQAQAK
jgi:hypothetical protein